MTFIKALTPSTQQSNSMLELLHGLARGERALQEQCILTHEQAKERFGRWLDQPSKPIV